MTLGVRDEELTELMDDPACDPERLRATLRRFGIVNRLVSGWGAVYAQTLRPHLAGLDRPARVLDLGSGGGDLAIRLAALAGRDGLAVHWTGADPDPRAHDVASSQPGADARRVPLRGRGARCWRRARRYDVVVSNHVLHHLGDDLADVPRAVPGAVRGAGPARDIARSRTAYALYTVGITPFAPGTFLRTDGLRSIRRSFTADELQPALRDDHDAWTVERPAPFRLLARGVGHG